MIDWNLMLLDGYDNDRDMLYDLYIRKNMTKDSLVRLLGISDSAFCQRLRFHGIRKGKGQYYRFHREVA